MDILSWQFLMALGSIIVLDLVLAGDNAVVIALASYDLPKNIRKKVIYIGTAGAVVIRMLMTLIAVQLLTVPYLQALGGLILLPVALQLLQRKDENLKVEAAENFWGAVKTIIVADVAMGIDNVLAIAGAAHGNFLLVFMGLMVSIPIVVGGSRFIGSCMERYPGLIYLGAAILAWTSGSMLVHDPIAGAQITAVAGSAADYVLPACFVIVVCVTGYWRRRIRALSVYDSK
jgi:YjbE family integral membrane protein